ncbi:MAG: ATP-binding protein, partial [Usitatibacter sp.]
ILVAIEASPRALTLTVRDDGKGFDASPVARRSVKSSSLGLISMEERARLAGGRLDVQSDPGHGTIIVAVFRMPAKPKAP